MHISLESELKDLNETKNSSGEKFNTFYVFSMHLRSSRFNRSSRLESEKWKTALGNNLPIDKFLSVQVLQLIKEI